MVFYFIVSLLQIRKFVDNHKGSARIHVLFILWPFSYHAESLELRLFVVGKGSAQIVSAAVLPPAVPGMRRLCREGAHEIYLLIS